MWWTIVNNFLKWSFDHLKKMDYTRFINRCLFQKRLFFTINGSQESFIKFFAVPFETNFCIKKSTWTVEQLIRVIFGEIYFRWRLFPINPKSNNNNECIVFTNIIFFIPLTKFLLIMFHSKFKTSTLTHVCHMVKSNVFVMHAFKFKLTFKNLLFF